MIVPGRILIIRLSSLGDILHALPAFRALRSAFPDAAIDWLVEERTKFVLSAVRGVDSVLVVDTSTLRQNLWSRAAWRRNWGVIRTLRSRSYDVAIDFQGLLKTAFLSLLSGARTRIGFSKELVRERGAHRFYHLALARPQKPLHVVALNQLLAELAGARVPSLPPELTAQEADIHAVESFLINARISDFAVINPGGGWYTKRWKPANYGALAERIHTELGLQVIVTTGPGEEALYDGISGNSGPTRPVHAQLPFLQLIPLLRRARLMIGGDTGPFHLACTLGTPAVGIFGPTSPVRNGPWAASDEALVRMLPCSFCNGRSCPTQNECMEIPVDDVFRAVVRRLGKEVEFAKHKNNRNDHADR